MKKVDMVIEKVKKIIKENVYISRKKLMNVS